MMDVNKVDKAQRYAKQRERIVFHEMTAQFHGEHGEYTVTLDQKGWHCTCHGFEARGMCPHIMTLERVLRPMVKRELQPYHDGQTHIGDVEKAARYEGEHHRVVFNTFEVTFHGDNNEHHTTLGNDGWMCDCGTFKREGICPHTLAIEIMLGQMLPEAARRTP
jgi:hypothetical protein